ncbi:MAG: LOG family protein [Candidatus Sungbacteria bacterium]|nr:LOG family protein [Candidatus Sungbacteria bacterium]
MQKSPHTHLKFKIAVSGAAETGHCAPNALELTKELGRQIVQHNAVLVTGATTGAPYWAAMGAKELNGFVVGVSPAATEIEHVKTYGLPLDYHDMIIYTGFGYSGRNLLLTRSADAVVVTCGRIGTLNEFTIAFEDNKVIGVLIGTGGMADELETIVQKAKRGSGKVIYEADPKTLVEKVLELVKKEKVVEI